MQNSNTMESNVGVTPQDLEQTAPVSEEQSLSPAEVQTEQLPQEQTTTPQQEEKKPESSYSPNLEQATADAETMDQDLEEFEDPYAKGLPEERLVAKAGYMKLLSIFKSAKPSYGESLKEARVVRINLNAAHAVNKAKIAVQEELEQRAKTEQSRLEEIKKQRPLTQEEERSYYKADQTLDAAETQKRILTARSEKYDQAEPFQFNFNTITDNESVRATIAEMAKQDKNGIMKARGGDENGVQTNEVTKGLAEDLGMDPETLVNFIHSESNDLIDPEHIVYAKTFIEQSSERLYDMAVAAKNNTSFIEHNGVELSGNELELAFIRQTMLHQEMVRAFKGKIANMGRSMQAMQIPAGNRSKEIQDLMANISTHISVDDLMKEVIATEGNSAEVTNVFAIFKSAKGYALDTAVSSFVNSILSNPLTHVVNGSGGVIKTVSKTGEDLISAVSQMGEVKVRAMLGMEIKPEDERYWDEFIAGYLGAYAHMQDSLDYALRALIYEEQYGGVAIGGGAADKKLFDANDYIANKPLAWAFNVLPKAQRFMSTRVMGGMDAFMRSFAERQELYKNAYVNYRRFRTANPQATESEAEDYLRRNIIAPTDEEIATAANAGLVATYSNIPDNKFFSVATEFQKAHPIGKLVMPFKRAPLNIIDDVLFEYNPASLAVNEKMQEKMFDSGMEARHRLLARYMMGSAFASFIVTEFAKGNFTGTLGDNPRERKARMEAGERPFSFRWKDEKGKYQYLHLKRLSPVSDILESIISFADIMSRKQEITDDDVKYADKYANAVVRAFNEATLERSSLKGIRDVLNVFKEPERYASSYLNNLGNSFVPLSGLRRFAKGYQSPYLHTADTLLGTIRANSPFLYTTEYPRVDSLGNPITKDDAGNLIPWQAISQTDNPVLLEQGRLAETTHSQAIGAVSKYIGTLKLTVKQYYELTQISRKEIKIGGKNFEGVLLDTINSSAYQQLTDHYKVIALKKTKQSFERAAKAIWLKRNPDFFRRLAKVAYGFKLEQLSKDNGTPIGEAQDALMRKIEQTIDDASKTAEQPLNF